METSELPLSPPTSMVEEESPTNQPSRQATEKERELWMTEVLDSSKLVPVPENVSYYWSKEDVYSPMLPFKKNVELTCIRFKARSSAKQIAGTIEIGLEIVVSLQSGSSRKFLVPIQIQVGICKHKYS